MRYAPKLLPVAFLLASVILLNACGGSEPAKTEPAAVSEAASNARAPMNRPAPLESDAPTTPAVEISDGPISLGTAVEADGSVTAQVRTFDSSDVVHASMPLDGVSGDSPISVYWTAQDGDTLKEEMVDVPAGKDHVTFHFSSEDGMKAGKYSVQMDVNFRPVGLVDFEVR